jgi:cell division topological specificity factor
MGIIMGFFSNFFKNNESSGSIAKNRLKIAITSDRAACSPEIMEQMKTEIIQVISKYVDIDTEGLDIKVNQLQLEEGGSAINAICANIPIKGTRNFRK